VTDITIKYKGQVPEQGQWQIWDET